VFLLKTTSKQPLLKASWIVQNWNQFWYIQLEDLLANFYFYMPTKSYTLILYHLQDHNIHSKSKKKFFLPLLKVDSSLLGSKKTTFSSRYEIRLFGFLFLGGLGTSIQNSCAHKVWNLKNIINFHKGVC
jgi:hypothetical protein